VRGDATEVVDRGQAVFCILFLLEKLHGRNAITVRYIMNRLNDFLRISALKIPAQEIEFRLQLLPG